MTLWIGNGAVPKNSSHWQLKELRKLNNSVHELFIFKIHLLAIDLTLSQTRNFRRFLTERVCR